MIYAYDFEYAYTVFFIHEYSNIILSDVQFVGIGHWIVTNITDFN